MRMTGMALLIAVGLLLQPGEGRAEVASITIVSPADHALIEAGEGYPLTYEVIPGPGGDHFHVWVDDKRGPGVHNSKGIYSLPKLYPGEHVITIKVVDKAHIPTGTEKSLKLTVQ
jgi:hypothetical protein